MLDLHRDAGPAGDGLAQLLEQIGQIRLGQRRRAQLQEQGAHLGQGAPGELAQLLQPRGALLRVARVDARQHLRDEAHREERLADGVVQVAGQALALLVGGQVGGLLVQPGVLDGHGQLVGDGAGREHVLFVEGAGFGGHDVEHPGQPVPDADGDGQLKAAVAGDHRLPRSWQPRR